MVRLEFLSECLFGDSLFDCLDLTAYIARALHAVLVGMGEIYPNQKQINKYSRMQVH